MGGTEEFRSYKKSVVVPEMIKKEFLNLHLRNDENNLLKTMQGVLYEVGRDYLKIQSKRSKTFVSHALSFQRRQQEHDTVG